MGESVYKYDDDCNWEFRSLASSSSRRDDVRSVVLVGRSGNGKSATGNSILGKQQGFESKFSIVEVTTTCELQTTTTLLQEEYGGLTRSTLLNVIDTPGLFDFYGHDEPELPGLMAKEIVKCMNMAKDGIHAILLVLSSVTSHFTIQEEEALVASLTKFFGNKISDYIIVVFTGGDELEVNEMTLDDYLGPENLPLMELLKMCGDRYIVFNNKTEDEAKKLEQLKQLVGMLDKVAETNGGRPYTNDLFLQLKKGEQKLRNQIAEVDSVTDYSNQEVSELKEQFQNTYEEQLKRITYVVELKLTQLRLEQQLAEERNARLRAEERAQKAEGRIQSLAKDEIRKLKEKLKRAWKETDELLLVEERAERVQMKSNDEIRKLREKLERAEKKIDELQKQVERGGGASLYVNIILTLSDFLQGPFSMLNKPR